MNLFMKHGSLFAGIEGFGLGFRNAGFQTVWAVEKEPFCQAIIRTHFPGTEIHSDVHDVGKHNLAAVDVLTAGFPCQDLSVAGKRAGLGGARSGLFWQAHRIIGELQPPWFVIENVPGLFSSNSGRDFAIVLRGLDELGYGLAWRVLDSQFFGVAQRRRRVFIVGCLGRPCPQAVLFESEGGEGDFAESGETRERAAGEVAGCLGSIGNGGFSANCEKAADGYLQLTPSLTCNGDQHKGFRNREGLAIARTITGTCWKRHDEDTDTLIAHPITASYGKQVDSSDRNGGPPNLVLNDADEQQQGRRSSGSGSSSAGNGSRPDAREPGRRRDSVGAIGTRSKGHGYSADEAAAGHYVSTAPDSDRMRSFTELPEGLDSARYRALGNAVTANVAQFIAERIKAQIRD